MEILNIYPNPERSEWAALTERCTRREEEITRFAMEVIRDPASEFQRQLISTMARLDPAQWKLMEQMLDELIRQRTAPPDKVPPPEDQ